jgi:hypothetical protein
MGVRIATSCLLTLCFATLCFTDLERNLWTLGFADLQITSLLKFAAFSAVPEILTRFPIDLFYGLSYPTQVCVFCSV